MGPWAHRKLFWPTAPVSPTPGCHTARRDRPRARMPHGLRTKLLSQVTTPNRFGNLFQPLVEPLLGPPLRSLPF